MSCPTARTAAAFAFASVAASTLASVGRSSPLGLPLITGYLVAGAAAGPYLLGMLTHDDCTSLADLINNDAMGFIGFSAGTKFLLSDMEGTIQPTLVLLTALVLVTYGLVGSCFYFAAPYLPLTADQTPEVQQATSMVIACLAARSQHLYTSSHRKLHPPAPLGRTPPRAFPLAPPRPRPAHHTSPTHAPPTHAPPTDTRTHIHRLALRPVRRSRALPRPRSRSSRSWARGAPSPR